ncbi:MAG TPA: hypothetical protein VMT64_14290 [Candidatus Binataceae bacterium]|nr:hypothetical protein [Candidatus Binataceae bacterium]
MTTSGVRALLLTLAVGLALGCGGSMPSTDLPEARQVMPALAFPDLRDYRGVIDCRMRESGIEQSKLADIARSAQIDFIFLGDPALKGSSDFGIGGFTSDVLIFPGASYKIGAGGAEIVALNLQHPLDESRDLITQIHDQGALALAVNLGGFSSPDQYALADAVEIYNLNNEWHSRSSVTMYVHSIFFGADHFFRNLDTLPNDVEIYDRIAGARVGLVAGVGAAPNLLVMGTHVGTYAQIFQVFTTHIIARERQADPMIDALKHGHAYVSFDFLGYVPNFMFYAQTADRKVMMGDEIPMTPGMKLKVEMPAAADKVVILGNGSEFATGANVSTFEFEPTGAAVYRVEAYRAGHPWIYSNPIYVR